MPKPLRRIPALLLLLLAITVCTASHAAAAALEVEADGAGLSITFTLEEPPMEDSLSSPDTGEGETGLHVWAALSCGGVLLTVLCRKKHTSHSHSQ